MNSSREKRLTTMQNVRSKRASACFSLLKLTPNSMTKLNVKKRKIIKCSRTQLGKGNAEKMNTQPT